MQKLIRQLKQINHPIIDLSKIDLPNVNITVLGKRGFGKSTIAKFILSKIKDKIVLIFDPMDEYSGDFYFSTYIEFQDHFLRYGLKAKKYVCKFSNTDDFSILFETAAKISDCYLIIEEADIFSKPNWVDEDFFKIIRYGRHFRQNYMAICRRTAEMNNNIISQSHYCLSFRQSIPADVEKLRKFGFTDAIQDLPKFHYELIEI